MNFETDSILERNAAAYGIDPILEKNAAAYWALPDDLRCHVNNSNYRSLTFHPRLFGDQVDKELFFRAGNTLRNSGFQGSFKHINKDWCFNTSIKRTCRLEKK